MCVGSKSCPLKSSIRIQEIMKLIEPKYSSGWDLDLDLDGIRLRIYNFNPAIRGVQRGVFGGAIALTLGAKGVAS